ncbi:MAG: DUF433 domain-containing protein [Chloroflexi bacterium]|nr:DUF433 domain-containing protein [Chloroflexota bacterium]
MVIQTITVDLARDGTLKIPPAFRRNLRNLNQLSITRVGSTLVLAPIPEKWTRAKGRAVKYEDGLIVRDPKIMFGTPVIAGTRIPARVIAGYVASGFSSQQIQKEFPQLSDLQINAATRFANKHPR